MIFLSACQSLPHSVSDASELQPITAQRAPLDLADLYRVASRPQPPADLWERIRRQLYWHAPDNARVVTAREKMLKQYRYLDVIAARSERYLYHIVTEIERRHLPIELALLPVVESALDPFAVSPSKAAGLWQIMPGTGRQLKLTQDWWFDGRRDVRQSTTAALDYLESLHRAFDGDWMLALAAYNSGKARVARVQRANRQRGLPTDYWSLRLPKETRDYVPRLLALAQIVAHPERYGATLPSVANRPAFEVVSTGGQLELYRAAKLAGVELKTLRALNPAQRRWATSPNQTAELLLPVGSGDRFLSGLSTLDDDERVEWEHYRIERGDSLGQIAQRFNTGIKLLREVNGIRGSRIRAGDTLLIPRGANWESSLALSNQGRSQSASTKRGYRVRHGDSLYLIAGKFKVSINDIISWNALDPMKYLQPGQQLTLFVGEG